MITAMHEYIFGLMMMMMMMVMTVQSCGDDFGNDNIIIIIGDE